MEYECTFCGQKCKVKVIYFDSKPRHCVLNGNLTEWEKVRTSKDSLDLAMEIPLDVDNDYKVPIHKL